MTVLTLLLVDDPGSHVFLDKPLVEAAKEQLGIQIVVQLVPWKDYEPKFQEALRGAADLVMIPGHVWLPGLSEKRQLAPMSDWVQKELKATVLEEIWDDLAANEQMYIFPLFTDGHIAVMDESVFNELLDKGHGFDPAILRNSSVNGSKTRIAMKAHPSEIFLDFYPYLLNHVNPIEWPLPVDSLESALREYCELKKLCISNTESFGNEEIAKVFIQGKVAYAVTWGGQLGHIWRQMDEGRRSTTRFYPLKNPFNTTWGLAIPSSCSNLQAAHMLMEWMTGPYGQYVDKMVASYAGSPVLAQTYSDLNDEFPYLQAQRQMLQRAHRLPTASAFQESIPNLSTAIHACYVGNQSVQETVESIQSLWGGEKLH